MMKHAMILLAPALVLAGCNKKVEMKNASVADVVAATKDAHFINPGQWATTSEIVSVDMAGLPPEASKMGAAMAKTMAGRKTTFESCVSEEDAKRPAAGLFAGGDKGHCSYDHFTMAGGKLSAVTTCTPPSGAGKMTMSMDGTYTGDAYTMNVEMKMAGTPGMMGSGMVMKAKNSGKRTGECKKS